MIDLFCVLVLILSITSDTSFPDVFVTRTSSHPTVKAENMNQFDTAITEERF